MSANHRRSTCASPAIHASQGILWVFFRVLLVGFGLFGPGAARAPLSDDLLLLTYIVITILSNIYIGPFFEALHMILTILVSTFLIKKVQKLWAVTTVDGIWTTKKH